MDRGDATSDGVSRRGGAYAPSQRLLTVRTIRPMTVELKATIRQRPPDHRGGYQLETAELAAEADTYELAKRQLEEQVPEGWQMLSIGRY